MPIEPPIDSPRTLPEAFAVLSGASSDAPVRPLAGATDLRVLLLAGELRVVHVSAHRSLREAIEGVTTPRVLRTIQLADEMGRRMIGREPRIGVAGLVLLQPGSRPRSHR